MMLTLGSSHKGPSSGLYSAQQQVLNQLVTYGKSQGVNVNIIVVP